MPLKTSILNLFPNKILQTGGIWFPSYAELFESTRLKKTITGTKDYKNRVKDKWPSCEIICGEWDYQLVNICFIENVLKNIIWCLASNYVPVVKIKTTDGVNLWESMFEQPFPAHSDDTLLTVCPYKSAPIWFPVIPDEQDIRIIGNLYRSFFIPKKDVQEYFDFEYETLIKGKRVLGVLCRGTDYIMTKPAGHPVQPPIEDVINLTNKIIEEMNVEFIYLATEEAAIVQMFDEQFPNKVITNKRLYYDSYYDLYNENEEAKISNVHFKRENDSYYKSLEYLSSVNLLSKCCGLIAGNCGGSRAALYLNGGRYEYSYLFDLGLY